MWNYFLDNASEEGNDDRVEDDDEDDDNEDDDDDDENGTSSLYKSKNKKPKYNAPGDDDDSMDNFDMAKSYPHLAQALGGEDGFDPTNPSVRTRKWPFFQMVLKPFLCVHIFFTR